MTAARWLSRSPTLPIAVAACAAALASCSPDMGKSRMVWVTGRVLVTGRPLPAGVVQFFAKDGEASGSTRIQAGRFGLSLPPGIYRVAVVSRESHGRETEGGGVVAAKSLVADRYGDIATSGLTADVTRRGTPFEFDLRE
mgnify:CR=1 FL=1